MKVLMICNPNSGQRKLQKEFDAVVGRLFIEGAIKEIKKFDTCVGFDYDGAIASYQSDLIVTIGGDGTLNKVVTSMVKNKVKTPLLVVPAGTVNDFSNYIGIPADVDGLAQLIRDFDVEQSDVFKCNDNYFINVFGAGMMADVAYKTPVEEKTVLGRFAYYMHGIRDIPRQIFHTPRFRIEIGGERVEQECLLVLVLNTKYAGGFTQVAPLANINDGKFDMCIIKKASVFKTADTLLKSLAGEHIKDEQVIYIQGDHVRIDSADSEIKSYDIDGEYGGEFPVDISVCSEKINVLVNLRKWGNK